VQAVLLSEAVRGGIRRGLRALAGVSLTFGSLLVALALGLSLTTPSGAVLRVLEVAGGILLVWLAVEGVRSGHRIDPGSVARRSMPPAARGVLAILLNPGAWLFLGAVASPLFGTANEVGGRWTALLAALALLAGAGLGDVGVIVLGGVGLRRSGERAVLWVHRALAVLLAGLGVWLIIRSLMP